MKLRFNKLIFAAAGAVCLTLAQGFAQAPDDATDALLATNLLAGTNQLPTANLVASETNGLVQTHELGPTNLIADANGLTQTNLGLATNEAVLSNDIESANAMARSNLALLVQGNRETANLKPPANSGSPGRLDYPAFRMIAERNIFNPTRSRRRTEGFREETPRPRSTEGFSLVGTMSYEKGMFAFFDGTSAEYRKVLTPGEEIAGYKVAEIGYNRVKLAGKTNQVELPIGVQLRHEQDGEWSLTQETASYNSGSTSSSSSSGSGDRGFRGRYGRRSQGNSGFGNSDSSAAPATVSSVSLPAAETPATEPSSGAADEVLKRLMQKREETMNK